MKRHTVLTCLFAWTIDEGEDADVDESHRASCFGGYQDDILNHQRHKNETMHSLKCQINDMNNQIKLSMVVIADTDLSIHWLTTFLVARGFVQKWMSIKGTNLSCSEIIRRGYNPDAAINLIYMKGTQEEIAINILGQIRQDRKNGETIDYNLSILFY